MRHRNCTSLSTELRGRTTHEFYLTHEYYSLTPLILILIKLSHLYIIHEFLSSLLYLFRLLVFLFFYIFLFFFFNDTATTEIYTLSLHDALPICPIFAFVLCMV